MDARLAEEEPEPDPYAEPEPEANLTVRDELENIDDGEVGDLRAGRLMDPNEGIGPDVDKDLIGEDVGIDAGAASAEEAAMHIVPDDQYSLNGAAVPPDRAVRVRSARRRRRPADLLGGVRQSGG